MLEKFENDCEWEELKVQGNQFMALVKSLSHTSDWQVEILQKENKSIIAKIIDYQKTIDFQKIKIRS